VSLPVRPDLAVGDQIRAGDDVAVLVTRDKGKPTSATSVVLERVTVDQVGRSDSPLGSTPGGSLAVPVDSTAATTRAARPVSWLVLVIPQEQAARLSQARWNGDLEVVLLPRIVVQDAGRQP
jgi:Flp pilus assembly protein RcpC/CpaB